MIGLGMILIVAGAVMLVAAVVIWALRQKQAG
jgi:hypothetical protein